MDIQCPTCGEPYDQYHMRYDEPHEWSLPEFLLKEFLSNGARFSGPNDPVKMAAEAVGWKFASNSVLSFTHCPACRSGSILADAIERRAKVAIAADLNGDDDYDDDDGFVSDISGE